MTLICFRCRLRVSKRAGSWRHIGGSFSARRSCGNPTPVQLQRGSRTLGSIALEMLGH